MIFKENYTSPTNPILQGIPILENGSTQMTETKAIQEAIKNRYGLVPQPRWEQSLLQAMEQLGLVDPGEDKASFGKILSNPMHLRELAGFLTVEESFFFRHESHFARLMDDIKESFTRKATLAPYRVWSAGCAGGQEPYSLAMLVADELDPSLLPLVEIIATDLDGQSIKRARQGLFTDWAFRGVSRAWLDKYFLRLTKSELQLCEAVRKRVVFEHCSLQEQLPSFPDHSLDAILFRNVAVYLDAKTISALYDGFARVLKHRGLVLIAPTDPRPEHPDLHNIQDTDMTVFRRTSPSEEPQKSRHARRKRPSHLSLSHSRAFDKGMEQRESKETTPRPKHAARQTELKKTLPPSDALLDSARKLADDGDCERALFLCEEHLTRYPNCSDGLRLRGQLHLHMSASQAAVRDFYRVLASNPKDMVTRYFYVLALQTSGLLEDARRQTGELLDELSALTDETLLGDGVTAAAELRRAALTLKRDLE